MGSYSRLSIFVLLLFVFASCSRQRYAHVPKVKGDPQKSEFREKEKDQAAVAPEQKAGDEPAVEPYAHEEREDIAEQQTDNNSERRAKRQLQMRELREKIPTPAAINRIIREEIKKVPRSILKEEEKKEEKKTQWAGALFLGLLLILAGALLGVAGSGSLAYLLGSIGFVLIIISLVLLVLGGA